MRDLEQKERFDGRFGLGGKSTLTPIISTGASNRFSDKHSDQETNFIRYTNDSEGPKAGIRFTTCKVQYSGAGHICDV